MKQFTCEHHTATASPLQQPDNRDNSQRSVWLCASMTDLNKIFPLHDSFIPYIGTAKWNIIRKMWFTNVCLELKRTFFLHIPGKARDTSRDGKNRIMASFASISIMIHLTNVFAL